MRAGGFVYLSVWIVLQYKGALKSSRPNNEKKIYNFKIIFLFQHNLP